MKNTNNNKMRFSKPRNSEVPLGFSPPERKLKSLTPKTPSSSKHMSRVSGNLTRSILKLPSFNKQSEKRLNLRKSISTLPTNPVAKCAYKTKKGSVEGVLKPQNQDAFLISPYLQGLKTQYLFGVFDGHGSYGHEVSAFLRSTLPSNIEHFLKKRNPETAVRAGIDLAIKGINDSRIDTRFSGSTLSLVLVKETELICANIGDSRAVLGRKVHHEWIGVPMSTDHKPENLLEKSRILRSNGRVMPCTDNDGRPLGPARVWLPHELTPGLAMSRSIGDKVAHSVGVIDKPEFTSWEIDKTDKFFVLASDGLWDFMTSTEVVKFIGTCIDKGRTDSCCQLLVKEATKRWLAEEDSVDDITIVVVFLKAS